MFPMVLWIVHLSVACFFLLVLWSGCAHQAKPDHVGSLQKLQREVERQLLHEARRVLSEGKTQESSGLLERFVANYPRSPLRDDAYWWLAQSYEQAGYHRQAIRAYRVLTDTGRERRNQDRAMRRIRELTARFPILSARLGPVRGMFISSLMLQDTQSMEQFLKNHTDTEITTSVVDIGCPPPAWPAFIQQVLSPWIVLAHQYRQQVLVAVNLRCLGHANMGNEWRDRHYHPDSSHLRPSQFFDLFSPLYQRYLTQLLEVLARLGVDGFLFRAGAPLGPFDGLTPSALDDFQKVSGVRPTPQAFFTVPQPSRIPFQDAGILPPPDRQALSPLFWQWSGWKTRERLRIIAEISKPIAERFPHIQFGLEVHALSVQDPVSALLAYSEDWAASGRSRFDMFLVQMSDPDGPKMEGAAAPLTGSVEVAALRAVIDEMVQFLGNPHKLWVIMPDEADSHSASNRSREERLLRWPLPDGVGRLWNSLHFLDKTS